MRILQINSVCGIRSTGRIVAELAEDYISKRHECRIAYGREVAPDIYKEISYRICNSLTVKKNGFIARILDNEGFNAKKQTLEFVKWADKFDPELLWLHNLHGYYINVDVLFKWIKSRPQMQVKWLLHDCWALTGHCSYFTMVKCEKWKTVCRSCIQKHEYPKSIVRDNCERNFLAKKELFCGVKNMTIVTPSHWLANLVGQSYLKEYPIEVRYNSINRMVFKPTPGNFRGCNGIEDKTIVLGVASAWSASKGLFDFIKLSKMLDDSYVIVLVGLTPKQRKCIPKSIISVEKTNNVQELAEIYTTADVFVNPSKQETFGMTTIEALACGTPVIVYKGTACEEVADIYSGIIVDQTPEAIYSAISEMFGK